MSAAALRLFGRAASSEARAFDRKDCVHQRLIAAGLESARRRALQLELDAGRPGSRRRGRVRGARQQRARSTRSPPSARSAHLARRLATRPFARSSGRAQRDT
jgi:hypothetical protein